MRLAIVGSQGKAWTPIAMTVVRIYIASAITLLEPDIVISGGSPGGGVDDWVRAEMHARGWLHRFEEFKPAVNNWMGIGGFKDRNMNIAESCDQLISIRSKDSTTYGSGWTADFAEGQLGKKVWRIKL